MLKLFRDVNKADGRRSDLLTALQNHIFAVIPAARMVCVYFCLVLTAVLICGRNELVGHRHGKFGGIHNLYCTHILFNARSNCFTVSFVTVLYLYTYKLLGKRYPNGRYLYIYC